MTNTNREVQVYLDQQIPEPYRTYIEGRNGSIARYLAGQIGAVYQPENSKGSTLLQTPYYIPWQNSAN